MTRGFASRGLRAVPAGISPTTVLGPLTFGGPADTGWTGFTLRGVIGSADLLTTANLTGNVVATLQFVTGTASTFLDAVYIGNWTGTNQNFDGNQVQLSLGGNTSWSVSVGSYVSDPAAFNFNPSTNGIVYAMFFRNAGTANGIPSTTASYFATGTQTWYMAGNFAGVTSFSGSANRTNVIEVVSQIVMQ